ncbi:alginate export family protein, partial [Burkholderia gladioli]
MQSKTIRRALRAACALALLPGTAAQAQTPPAASAVAQPACTASRPAPSFNRWQENWGALADPCLPRKPLDALKYIPLSGDPSWYLSLGANLRERFEFNDAPLFGLGSGRADGYVIQRAQVHADARFGEHVQAFVQL